MDNFIEELYYGNIDPQARGFTKNSRIKKAYDKITELEKLLKKVWVVRKRSYLSAL